MDKKTPKNCEGKCCCLFERKMQNSSNCSLLDYKGITVNEDNAFRRSLERSRRGISVTKIPLSDVLPPRRNYCADEYLKVLTSIAFCDDPVALAKAVNDFAQRAQSH